MSQTIKDLLFSLERDIDALGWDQPASLWVVEDLDDDPYLVKVFDFYQHPCEIMDALPVFSKPSARGLVLANEAWMVEESLDKLNDIMDELSLTEEEKETTRELMRLAVLAVPLSQNPNRTEARIVQCIMKTGEHYTFTRKRGQEPTTMEHTEGRVVDSMRRVLGMKDQT